MCNGHSPTEINVRSGVTSIQRPWRWPKPTVLFCILVWESLTGVISVRLLRFCYSRGSVLKQGGWCVREHLVDVKGPVLVLDLLYNTVHGTVAR
jgi:hypothetical protein